MNSGALLDVQGLEAAYGASQVLFGIDLKLERGQVATLLGRNGMGKSTAIRAVLGLTPAKGGTIALHGQRIERLRADQIARLGVALVVWRGSSRELASDHALWHRYLGV